MLVKFIKDCKGTENGYEIIDFKAGETRQIGKRLYEVLKEQGCIKDVKPPRQKETQQETKKLNPVEENK